MTALQIAKSRSMAREEAVVGFRGAVANPDWQGLAVTVAGEDANGGRGGYVGAPTFYAREFNTRTGGTDTFGVDGALVTDFTSYSPAFIEQCRARILRPVNGVIQEIRDAPVASAAVDYWTQRSPQPITGTFFETRFGSTENLTNTYTFGVAVFGSDGRIGPVSTVSIAVSGPTHTILTVVAAQTTGSNRTMSGTRNASLPAVTGLTAQIRSGTTHNIELNWDSAGAVEYVVLLNWDGSADRLRNECTLTLETGGAPILANDMVILTSDLILDEDTARASNRTKGIVNIRRITNPSGAEPVSGSTFAYVPFGGALAKPDITYPEHYLEIIPNTGVAAAVSNPFHSGTNQNFWEVLVPGRTYEIELEVAAASSVNVRLQVEDSNLDEIIGLTTALQTIRRDFTVATMRTNTSVRSWRLTAQSANVALRLVSVKVRDKALPHARLGLQLPANVDVRDHTLIKTFPISFGSMTSRTGSSNTFGWTLATLFENCKAAGAYPHLQIEWIYPDQYYYDLVTFLCAPASSGEPLALKREALGFGPIHQEFDRWSYEDGNERWNDIMRLMFGSATDSVTGVTYDRGELSAMFAAKRRAVMESNPYWPTANPPVEWSGGWLNSTDYTVKAAQNSEIASVALYIGGWDVNRIILADSAEIWGAGLTRADANHRGRLQPVADALEGTGIRLGIYEAGPGYQLSGLNGATLTRSDEVVQEVIMKSVGTTTALMSSLCVAAEIGFGPYNFFTWGQGPYWQAGRPASEGGGFYRVAAFPAQMHGLLGRCRLYAVRSFISREQTIPIFSTIGVIESYENVPRAKIYHFESLDYPGRHGILYLNTSTNYDAFGVGHPDYVEGDTGAAEFRYHTGLPASAAPYKVLRNEGNFRHHDAFQVGFRPNVVSNAIDGYVADPLCVDLTVTPEDFTVDDPTLRTLTLLGGNCRLEVFTT